MTPRKRRKPKAPRRAWTRSPAQKPHSTPKGDKGYSRTRHKDRTREDIDDSTPPKRP
jgi:hypothetical protein